MIFRRSLTITRNLGFAALVLGCGGKATQSAPLAASSALLPDCAMVADSLHPSPIDLLGDYLQRDGAGEFLSDSTWLKGALACPGRRPQWADATVLAKSPTYTLVGVGTDTAKFDVTLYLLGHLHGLPDKPKFEASPGVQEAYRAILLHTKSGWRIDQPILQPHVLGASLAKLNLSSGDRRVLDSLVKAQPKAP